MDRPWNEDLEEIAIVLHVIAISGTVFRLGYWWWIAWYGCLIRPTEDKPGPRLMIANWMSVFTLSGVLWSARISILCSIIRVGNPSRKSTQIMYFTLAAFVAMYLALLGQRIHHCLVWSCRFLVTNVIAQLITDSMASMALIAFSTQLLRPAKFSRSQRIVIRSVFSASIVTTIISIVQSIILYGSNGSGILLLEHLKVAISLLTCNLFMFLICASRLFLRGRRDPERGEVTMMEFTTVVYIDGENTTETMGARTNAGTGSGTGSRTGTGTGAVSPVHNESGIDAEKAGDAKSSTEFYLSPEQ